MIKQSSHFWCPHCYSQFEKDDSIRMLISGASIVGEGMNWSGDLERELQRIKRVKYCKNCRKPIDFHALLRGDLDCRRRTIDPIWFTLLWFPCYFVAHLSFWLSTLLAIAVTIVAAIILGKLNKTYVRRFRLSHKDFVDSLPGENLENKLTDAAMNGDMDRIEALIACSVDVNATDKYGTSALAFAAKAGHLACVNALLAAGADPKGKHGARALWLACSEGRDDCVKALINAGAATSGDTGRNALDAAVSGGHAGCVSAMIAGGANVNAIDSGGQTPLMLAAKAGHAKVMKVLISAGANLNAMDNAQYTALFLAANHKCIQLLIEAGADVNARSAHGTTVLMHAAARTEKADTTRKSDGFKALDRYARQIAYLGDLRSVKALIAAGADVNAVSDDGTTALIMAARLGHDNVVSELIASGANVNVTTSTGETALSVAKTSNTAEILKSAGAFGV